MSASPPAAAGPAPPAPRRHGRRLAGDVVAYGLGGMAAQIVAVLLVPIYARELGEEGVGVTGVLNSAIAFAMMLAGLALPQAFFRWYLRDADTEAERARVLGTTLLIRVAASAVAFAAVIGLAYPLSEVLYGGEHWAVFALAAPIVAFDSFLAIPQSVLRAHRRARSYVAISLLRAATGTLLILTLVVALRLGVIGVPLGAAIAAAVSATVSLFVLARSGVLRGVLRGGGLRRGLDVSLGRAMLRFSLPLVPAAVAAWTLNLADRPILQAMTGDTAAVGEYTLGYTAGLVVNALAVQPFLLAWGAAYWEISRADDAPRTFARILTWFVVIAAGAALLLASLGTDALRLLVGEGFELSRFIVPFSAFAYVLYGVHGIVAAGLNLADRTPLVTLVMGIAAAAGLALTVLLVPPLGIFGAATATVTSYALLAAGAAFAARRLYPVPWQTGRVVLVLAAAAGLSAAALLGPDHVLWRLGCLAAYPALLLGLRIVAIADARRLVSLLRPG